MKRLFVLLACLLAVPAQGQILSIIMGGTNQRAATPTFSPAAGAVANPTTVTASTSTSDGCTIYFDTSNPPVTAQTTYSVTTGVTLYAQARGCAHHRDSSVGSATYTISGPLTIAHDANSDSGDCSTATTGSPCTWSHTITAASPGPDLWVGCGINEGNNVIAINSVTYNGTSMTAINSSENGYFTKVWLYHLFSPATGTHSIIVTPSGSTGLTTSFYCKAVSFTGASGSALDNSGSATNTFSSTATPTVSITTANANAWIIDVAGIGLDYGSAAPSSPQTQVGSYHLIQGVSAFGMSYHGPIVTPAATNDGWTETGDPTTNHVIVVASIKPGP